MVKSYTWVLGASLVGFGLTGSARADQVPGKLPAQMETQINARLHKDTDLKNNKIDATVDNGVVTLKGTVDTDAERVKAAKLAMIGGVNAVDNQLKVGSEGVRNTVSDSTITARLKTELVADATLRPVRVETNNAVVTLNGTVASEAAHVRALELARSTSGVSRIEDNIKVLASGEASTNR